jgi:hypothetical protein
MKKYMILFAILLVSSFLLIACNNGVEKKTIYYNMEDNNVSDTEVSDKNDSNSEEQINNYTNITEKVAVEKMFRYLKKQDDEKSRGFEIQVEEKKEKYIMKASRLIGEDENLSSVTIGTYSVEKANGKISPF